MSVDRTEPYPPHPGTVVASALAGQLGSDDEYIGAGATDMRRFTVIDEDKILFLIYAKIRSRKNKAWATIRDEYLNLRVGVGGRGRRDIIRMEQVSHGHMADVSAELEAIKPPWFQRNVTQRDWQEEAIRSGEV